MCKYVDQLANKVAGEEVASTYEGRHLSFPESFMVHPARSSGLVEKGDPVIVGENIVGVAFSSAGAATDVIAIDTEGIWALEVYGYDHSSGNAVDVGDTIYIDPTTAVLSKDANGDVFGYALTPVSAGQTAVCAVKVHWDADIEIGDIPDGAIVEDKIANLAVTEGKIGPLAVTETKIGGLAVTEPKIGALAVTEGKLGAGAVTVAKIGDLAVSPDKLGANVGVSVLYPHTSDGALDHLAAADKARVAILIIEVTETFAANAGAATIFSIGDETTANKFVNAKNTGTAGDIVVAAGIIDAGEKLVVTATERTVDGEGAIRLTAIAV